MGFRMIARTIKALIKEPEVAETVFFGVLFKTYFGRE